MTDRKGNNQLLLSAKYLLPTSRQKDHIPNGAMVIENDTIAAVGARDTLVKKYPDARQFHERHGLIMPGLINTHTHASMSCFRGLADDLPLMTWLQEHIFPVETKLTAEMVYEAALISIIEMIKSGTTSFCDMYLFADEVAKAADMAGMRCWTGEVLYDFPSPNYGDLENGFQYVRQMLQKYENHPLITVTIDPHSIYTCSPELLSRLGKLAKERDKLLVIHLSENDAEVETCKKRYGCTPVEHLDKLGLLGPQTLADHCVKLSAKDISLLAKKNVKISHCIESNMKLASGIAPVSQLMDKGVTISIGTDGSASNNDVDMFGEMNSVAQVHKVIELDPTAMTAEQTLQAATIGGAQALGVESQLGTIEEGKKADCIVLDLNQPHLIPMYNIPSHLVYVARGTDVIHSFINGKMVMRARKILTLNENEILSNMQAMSHQIKKMREENESK